jgi:ubiquinone/menaquinone biosynthesis C-methylase UbiE
LDIGCGLGMQTIELAKLSKGQIDALDNHQPFLDQLDFKIKKRV